jgi:hypothetical protein
MILFLTRLFKVLGSVVVTLSALANLAIAIGTYTPALALLIK